MESISRQHNKSNTINPSPHNDTFWHVWERNLLKTFWKKEKMVISIFFFTHNLFYSIKDRNYHLYYIYFVICKCFNLEKVKFLLSRKGLKLSLSDRKNNDWRRRTCWVLAFSPFSTLFSKASFSRSSKVRIVW